MSEEGPHMKHLVMASVLLALFGCGSGGPTGSVAVSEGVDTTAADALVAGAPDPVLAWNAITIQLIAPPGGVAKPGTLGFVDEAIVHTAIYDAVEAIHLRYAAFASRPAIRGPASAYAAVASAGHEALVALYPASKAGLDAALATSLAYVRDGRAKDNGVAIGKEAADAVLALRANDGRNAGGTFTTSGGVGVWVPTPPGFLPALTPWVRFITPWTMTSPSQFRPGPPPSLESELWIRDYKETKALGAKVGSTRTPEQTDIGLFWSDNPELQVDRYWRRIAIDQGLSLEENARFFAMLTVARTDATIGCWDAKFQYAFWRPVTAIRAGGGNPALTADPSWESNAITPNHPEYPAAHGCASSASAHTLQAFFGTDDLHFSVDSTVAGLTTPVRTYERFSDLLEEVKQARVYGGMHYRNSTEQGALLGQRVVQHMLRHYFRHLGRHHHGGKVDEDQDGED
jgi:hypothetical protein